jgi:outer membrane protein OmpA-like peptidoglycan-associated protein
MERRCTRQIARVLSILVALVGISSAALAEEHLRGVVTGRGTDGSLFVRTDTADTVVLLNENTKVRERSGVRSIEVDVPALVPGLRVDVEGRYESTTRFMADRITFTRGDLKTTRDIEGGLTPTNQAVQANRALIDSNQQQNNQRFNRQQETLEQQDRRIAANDEKIVATSGAVEAANGRIANLDDYTVVDTLTVYFKNGRSTISPDVEARLRQLAQKAKQVDGYSLQVEGHASAVGDNALNQRLSRDRAEAVAAVLQQSGIPSTKMFVPASLGVSDQVASNKTRDGQAQNRRVVVRVLQNRGITGN